MEERNHEQLLQELNKLKRAQARMKRRTTFLLCIIAMLVMITSTLAWFTLSNFASVSNIDLKISTAPQLYLDIENRGTDLSLWKKVLTNEMINSYLTSVSAPRLEDQLLDPVTTSNGISFFGEHGGSRTANKTSFIEFKVWFIATTDMWVHLSGRSVEIAGKSYTTSVTTEETGLKSDVTRALRISFEDSGSAAIYEPNKGASVNGQNTFEVSENFAGATRLFHLDKLTPKQITVRIWAEGNDPECDDDIQDAKLAIQMLFGGTDDNDSSFE